MTTTARWMVRLLSVTGFFRYTVPVTRVDESSDGVWSSPTRGCTALLVVSWAEALLSNGFWLLVISAGIFALLRLFLLSANARCARAPEPDELSAASGLSVGISPCCFRGSLSALGFPVPA